MKRLLILLGALGLLVPSASWAANGGACTSIQFTKAKKGKVTPAWCVLLLDNITTASGGPISYDLTGTSNPGSAFGLPDNICFVVGFTDSTAGTVTLTTSQIQGGLEDNITNPSGTAVTLDVDASSPAGNTKACVNTHDAPLGQVLNARWSANAGFTQGFDIMAIGYDDQPE